MKSKLLVLAVLSIGLQGVAHAFPADAEANYSLPPADTYADQQARAGVGATAWGVSKRQVEPHNPFPFGGGYIDD
ncbi:MAG TPA: hypothetical protein VFB75_05930 [Burkholderiales bacterium]|nr:hypothetical protein [Burkholderiales bacterium]